MKRREFIKLLGGVAIAQPITAFAQSAKGRVARIGFFNASSPQATARRGLARGRCRRASARWRACRGCLSARRRASARPFAQEASFELLAVGAVVDPFGNLFGL